MMMNPRHSRFLAVVGAVAAVATGGIAAEAARTTSSTAQRSTAIGRASPSGRAVLPDPVLLDGSTHVAEKKSEYGMIGDFELPGDENNRDGKVGGSPGGGQEEENKNQAGTPGGGGGQKEGAAQPGGGKQGAQAAEAGGGAQDPKAAEKQGGGAGEPNAQAQGMKVAELGGDPSGAGADPDGKKPAQVAIGDKAMRIPQQTQSTAGVVGAQQPAGPNTQVYEKATGTGGKGPTGQQGPNRIEKGRTIPSGL